MNHHYSCALALRNSELCGHQQHAVGTPMKKGRLGDPQLALCLHCLHATANRSFSMCAWAAAIAWVRCSGP